VEWRLGDGSRLRLIANFASVPVPTAQIGDDGRLVYASAGTPGAPQSASFALLPPR